MRRLPVLALVLALVACGSHKDRARASVADYIARVDAIEQGSQSSLVPVRNALADFARSRNRAKVASELSGAERALARLRLRLDKATAPPQAAKLSRLVRSLVAQQEQLVVELRDVTVFDPKFLAALQPLATANAAAQAKLAKAPKDPAVAAAAVGEYRAAIEQSLPTLHALRPPPLERPLYDAQVRRLDALDRTLGALATALRAKDPVAIAKADHAVSVASVSVDARANQLSQRAAVVAYNARVARLRRLQQAILDERNRLQVNLR